MDPKTTKSSQWTAHHDNKRYKSSVRIANGEIYEVEFFVTPADCTNEEQCACGQPAETLPSIMLNRVWIGYDDDIDLTTPVANGIRQKIQDFLNLPLCLWTTCSDEWGSKLMSLEAETIE